MEKENVFKYQETPQISIIDLIRGSQKMTLYTFFFFLIIHL